MDVLHNPLLEKYVKQMPGWKRLLPRLIHASQVPRATPTDPPFNDNIAPKTFPDVSGGFVGIKGFIAMFQTI